MEWPIKSLDEVGALFFSLPIAYLRHYIYYICDFHNRGITFFYYLNYSYSMQLYNTLSAKERATLIEEAGQERLTISFYKYAHIGNTSIFRNHLFINWNELDVLGRIYVAEEGINAQLSVPAENFGAFKDHLDGISFLRGVRLNIAIEQDNKSFLKLKVKVRKKIVADGLNDNTFDVTDKGYSCRGRKIQRTYRRSRHDFSRYAQSLRKRDRAFQKCDYPRCRYLSRFAGYY